MKYYKLAAENGDNEAQQQLAKIYDEGIEVPKKTLQKQNIGELYYI